jgi:hypothetical protein
MSSIKVFIVAAITLPPLALAAKPVGNEVCVAACYNALKDIKFTDQPGGNATSCLNDLRISSTYACARIKCQHSDIEPGVSWWQKQCKHSSKVITVAGYYSMTDNVPVQSLSSLPTVEYKDNHIFNQQVQPAEDAWDLVYGTLVR